MIQAGAALTSEVLLALSPKEYKEHAPEEMVHGFKYSYTHMFGRTTADNIVKSLDIAQKNELASEPLIKMLDDKTNNDANQSAPKVK